MAQREREILEDAVSAVTQQAVKADELVARASPRSHCLTGPEEAEVIVRGIVKDQLGQRRPSSNDLQRLREVAKSASKRTTRRSSSRRSVAHPWSQATT